MPNELSYEVSLKRSNQIRADLPRIPRSTPCSPATAPRAGCTWATISARSRAA